MDAAAYVAMLRRRVLGETRRKYARTVTLPKPDSRTWRQVGDDYYTLVPPAQGPPVDAAHLRCIHDFDPEALVLWRKQLWRSPEGHEHVFTCVGIGRYEKHVRYAATGWNIDRPPGYTGPVPNIVELWWKRRRAGLPDAPRPFDGRLVEHLRLAHNLRRGAELGAEIREASQSERDRRLTSCYGRLDERDRQFHKATSRLLAGRTLEELIGWYVAARETRKPFAFLGGRAA